MSIDASTASVTDASVTLLAGDANNDNVVDAFDFSSLVGSFDSAASVPGSGCDARADFNGDGFVNTADFNLLTGSFGTSGDQ